MGPQTQISIGNKHLEALLCMPTKVVPTKAKAKEEGLIPQGRGNYRGQGYQGQTPYGQPHGLGNQAPYHQASYNPNYQGGMGYNNQYGQGIGVSSGGYPLNSGNQYGNSQYPPLGFNVPRTYGTQFPPNPSRFGNAPPPLPSPKSNLEALMESNVGAQAKKNVEFEDEFK
ncbi:transcriptional regulatory protein LGE1-like [Spinacia oleracea]|uniref:Transcriptional regulatory protein LGE1-like n=1 Tax=Spinacia oleracea TaxID=3562 RepID=A0A9R0IJH7_SPIOL|nr:transcriptional regulatory protein LGE1-like [Spinacia oleracea]